jgi:non-specific serine/threonine protein kinase/serine/threonine-protein kinase
MSAKTRETPTFAQPGEIRTEPLRELLAALLKIEPSERRDFLLSEPGEELLGDAMALLEETMAPSGTWRPPPAAETEDLDPTLDERPAADRSRHPDRVGPYRVLQHIGSGGMGDVYLAEQLQPVRRRVAIKLIRTAMRHGDALARFRAEQQAMARLSHPNVAKLFDAGTSEQGFPYFVMEYVEGAPLTRFADARTLSVRQRVAILIEVCRGVEHAHRRGILHRDLKPGNVLVEEVEGRPTPRIIDFGIAKALEEPLTDRTLTLDRQALGTPAYMSPEALSMIAGEADLDTRADVYSLGVILFELLVGCRPVAVEGSTLENWRQRLAAGDPPRPSTRFLGLPDEQQELAARDRQSSRRELARLLAGDLGWIAWKALAPDREDRYASVRELGADLEAWLDRRPVAAHPPTLGYRVRKLVQRHRAVALAIALAVLATFAGLAGTTVGFLRATAEAERATREARTSREVSDFLVDLFEVSDPRESQGETVTARELLDRGAERIRDELRDEPRTQTRLMEVMGRVYTSLGLLDAAEPLLREALERGERSDADGLETAAVLDQLGFLLYKRNADDEAAAALKRALEIRRRRLGDEHQLTAKTLLRLGDLCEQQGRFDAAEAYLGEALRIQEKILGPEDVEVAETLSRLAVVSTSERQLDEALAFAQRALAIREAALGPDHLDVAKSLNSLGSALWDAGRQEAARAAFGRALEIRERVLGPEHPDVGQSLLNFAISHDEFDVAVPRLERALAIWEKALGPGHPRVAKTLSNLAYYYQQERRLEEAEALERRAYEISLAPDFDPRFRVEYITTLGKIASDLGRTEDAEERFRRGLRHAEEGGVPDGDWRLRQTLEALAELLRDQGRIDEAEGYEQRLE